MSDELRSIARAGLAPLVEEVPRGPEWDDLAVTRASPAPRRVPGWLVGLAAAVVVFGLVGIGLVVQSGEPTPPVASPATTEPTEDAIPPFDAEDAALTVETLWHRVLAGLFDTVLEESHPDASLTQRQLMGFSSLGDDVQVDVDPEPFGTDVLPQVCFSLSGSVGTRIGSLVFRLHEGEWLPWEIRSNVELCSLDEADRTPQPPMVATFEIVEPVPLRVFTLGPNGTADSVIVLDEGTIEHYERQQIIGSYMGSVADSQRNHIIWSHEPTVMVFPEGYSEPVLTLDEEDLSVLREPNQGMRGVPTPDGSGLWLVTPGREFGSIMSDAVAVLYSVPAGERLAVVNASDNAFPVGATNDGIIFNTQRYIEEDGVVAVDPLSQRVVHVNADGNMTGLGRGEAIAVAPNTLVRFVCPADEQECDLYRRNELVASSARGDDDLRSFEKPRDGTWLRVGGPIIPSDAMPLSTISPDGSKLLVRLGQNLDVNGTPATAQLVVVDLSTGETTTIADDAGEMPLATWSTDGKWVVTFWGSDVTMIEAANPDNTFTYEDLIPDGQWPLAAG